MPKRIPISSLKRLCNEQGLKLAVLTAFDGNRTHVVTYGKTAEDCAHAAAFGNDLKEKMGWPEELCKAQPHRVKKLKERISELETQVAMLEEIVSLDKAIEGLDKTIKEKG